MKRRTLLFLLGCGVVLGVVGYGYYQQRTQRQRLWQQMHAAQQTLTQLNAQQYTRSEAAVQRLHHEAERRGNRPGAVAIMQAGEALARQTKEVLAALQTVQDTLLQRTGNVADAAALRHFDEAPTVAQVMADSAANSPVRRLQRQLDAYAALLRPWYPAPAGPAAGPELLARPPRRGQWLTRFRFGEAPLVVASAALTQIETEVLAFQAHALQQLARPLAQDAVSRRVEVVAAVKSNQVAPGGTYRARLFLQTTLVSPSLAMRCNGQPVPVDSAGHGHVRFRVPARLGGRRDTLTAYWAGEIRLKAYGRDSTFRVRVPYRIAPR